MFGFVRWFFGLGPLPEAEDGFGQTLGDDLRYWVRFRRCYKLRVVWRPPGDDERRFFDGHPVFGRFGDQTYAVAVVDGRVWVARDNDWFGFPDPPQFAFFVIEGETIWAAAGFDDWPRRWIFGGGLRPI